MPEYTYRREDGTTFTVRQGFNDDPLTTDPETGQKVKRIVQRAGIIFKGSGFYVNDSKASKQSLNGNGNGNGNGSADSNSESNGASTNSSNGSSEKATASTKAASDA